MARIFKDRADVLPLLAEVFREHGFEGASLSLISRRTGLGKGSLYHFFSGGKEAMAKAVLGEIDAWFEANIFRPLQKEPNPLVAIRQMIQSIEDYFQSGRRVCLVGVFALGDARAQLAKRIRVYFVTWRDSLADALRRAGVGAENAKDLAEEAVAAIQGALVLGRALDDPGVFRRTLNRMETGLASGKCRKGSPESRRLRKPESG